MDVYKITITHAPTPEECVSYFSLTPFEDTEKYHAITSRVSIDHSKKNPPSFAYIRVSREEQGKKENSPVAQREGILRYLAEHGIDSSQLIWVIEIGKKRDTPWFKRPDLVKIVENLKTNSCVYIYRRDRLGAGPWIAETELVIRRAGGRVVSAEGNNEDRPDHELIRGISDVFALQELRRIGDRVRTIHNSRRRKKQTYCRRVYGYKKVSIVDGRTVLSIVDERRGRNEDFKLVPVPEEQEIIKFIVAQREVHGLSWEAIANRLNANKVPPPDSPRTSKIPCWHHCSCISVYKTHKKMTASIS